MKLYFSHDFEASLDEKCAALLMTHRLEGYGLFWRLIERLATTSDHTHCADYNLIAYDMRCSNLLVKSVVEDFGLFAFTEDGKRFYSESLMRRLRKMDEISVKRSHAAHRRWDDKNANASKNGCNCNANASKNDANAMQMHTNLDAKEMRRDEHEIHESPPTPPKGDRADVFQVRFDSFWEAYPNHTGSGAAKKAFLKIKPSQELTERMIRAVETIKCSDQWKKENGRFIPHAATWLNQERWNDAPPPPQNKPAGDNKQERQKNRIIQPGEKVGTWSWGTQPEDGNQKGEQNEISTRQ